jgi:hypothetical protein
MPHRLLLPVLAAAAIGCLQAGRPVDGRQLYKGRSVEKPSFVGIDKAAYVLFQVRTAPAAPPRSATYDLWLANYDTGETRPLVQNIADRDAWRPQVDMAGIRYMIVDESSVEGGSSVDVPSPVGTLVRLDLTKGVLERIPNASSFSISAPKGEFFYRTVAAGAHLPELHFRTSLGSDRDLGPSAGTVQVTDIDRVYFVAGEDKVLSRITSADGPVQAIHPKVTRFQLSDDEKWVALTTTVMGKGATVVMQIDTGLERQVPGINPCCWLSFSGTTFVYSESGTGNVPGKLHSYDVAADRDQVLTLPQGLSDVSSVMGRPNSKLVLFMDAQGRLALVDPANPAAGRVLDVRPVSPSFTDDGRFFVYIQPDPQAQGEGQLLVQDADFLQPPRLLSPAGSLVPQGGYFFITDGGRRILVFWGHFGRNASDLYFGNYETGDLRVVANGISEVTVTSRRVFGILRVSEQDLVGELVNKDLIMNQETVLAHDVADATLWGPRVAFVLRGRVESERDGLWATGIDGVSGGMKANP